jgi:hypothetical protein
MAVPTLTHKSEIWTITKKQEAKIETAEMKILEECSRLHKEGPNTKY